MKEATAHRLGLARELAALYAKNEKISAVFVAGSVARGWADEHSDLEIDILWKEDPTDEDRMAPIREANGEIVRFLEWEDNDWSEVYLYKGVKMEMSHFLQRTVEKMTVKPERLVERITTAYRSEARAGLAVLQKVAEEVLALAKK